MKEKDPDGCYKIWTETPVSYQVNGTQLDGCELKGFYVGWGWTKKFQNNARHVLETDVCHTKGCFGGVLKVLVGKDAMDSLVLVGLGYAPIENGVNWNWFLKQANEHLDGIFSQPNLTLIVDWEKGLNSVQNQTWFNARLKRCTEHAFKNLSTVPGVNRTAKGHFTSIFMAGNLDFRQKLIDDFGDSFGERAKK